MRNCNIFKRLNIKRKELIYINVNSFDKILGYQNCKYINVANYIDIEGLI